MSAAGRRPLEPLVTPLIENNPVTRQVLGICPALAVTTSLETALTMAAALAFVLTLSNAAISLIRNQLPRSIRLIVQITIIASLVIVAEQLLGAFAPAMSATLSVFVGLIVTNCVVLGRAEAHAMHHGVISSALDGLGNAVGHGLILACVGIVRELLGSGRLLGVPLLPLVKDGGWYEPIALMLMPPSAFFIIGLLTWGLRSFRADQFEQPEHRVRAFEAAGGVSRGAPSPVR